MTQTHKYTNTNNTQTQSMTQTHCTPSSLVSQKERSNKTQDGTFEQAHQNHLVVKRKHRQEHRVLFYAKSGTVTNQRPAFFFDECPCMILHRVMPKKAVITQYFSSGEMNVCHLLSLTACILTCS